MGNHRDILISELSGRCNIRVRAASLGIESDGFEAEVLSHIKELEAKGLSFEDAEGSFELLLRRAKGAYLPPFEILEAMVVSERRLGNQLVVQAVTKVKVSGEVIHTAAEGIGPVNALDSALRKALLPFYPGISAVRLVDYKVRILDPEQATAAITRVMIEAACGDETWSTVGCSQNIIDASLHALTESFEHFLLKSAERRVETAANS